MRRAKKPKVYLKNPRPTVFPYERINRVPTVAEVRAMALRLPWPPTVYQKSRSQLPILLEGVSLGVDDVTVEIPRFRAGSDPYVLYDQCLELDNSYPQLRSRGKWLSSVARLLICWVAEELKAQGVGSGFDDHFRKNFVS